MSKAKYILIPTIILFGCIFAIVYKQSLNMKNVVAGQWSTVNKLDYVNLEDGKSSDTVRIQLINYADTNHKIKAGTDFIEIKKDQTKIEFPEDSLNPGFKINCTLKMSKDAIEVVVLPRDGSAGFGIFPGKYDYQKVK